MKIFISADMEGASGITSSDEVILQGNEEYERGRKLLTGDVNAAIQGAFEGGASRIVVNESHWIMRNLILDQLDSRVEIIRGKIKQGCMMEGLDESFSAVFFIGYHTKPDSYKGIMSHAFMGKEINCVYMNGEPVGEGEINAAYAGYFKVPVVLVTGDQVVCNQMRGHLGDIETVVVKQAIGRFTAQVLHPEITRERIFQAAKRAVAHSTDIQPFQVNSPVAIAIEFNSNSMAEVSSWIPTVERVGPRRVEFKFDDWQKGMGLINVITWVARHVADPIFM